MLFGTYAKSITLASLHSFLTALSAHPVLLASMQLAYLLPRLCRYYNASDVLPVQGSVCPPLQPHSLQEFLYMQQYVPLAPVSCDWSPSAAKAVHGKCL